MEIHRLVGVEGSNFFDITQLLVYNLNGMSTHVLIFLLVTTASSKPEEFNQIV